MTDLDLDAIEARANAATEGPWLAYDERSDLREENPDVNPMWVVAHMEPDGVNWVRDIADIGGGEQDETDAEFIAHARTDVPALVAALREARAEMERLRGPFPCCEHCVEYPDDDPHLDGVKDQHDLPCQICESWRDDWRRRHEALRDGVTALCDDHDACDDPNCRDLIHGFRAVVARVEGDES